MDRMLTNFIRALRSSEVRVSSGEAIEAARAVSIMGYSDRDTLRDTLACVLAKSAEEKDIHDHLFDLYFSQRPATSPNSSSDSDADQDGENDRNSSGQEPPDDLLDLATSGDETAINMAVEKAAEEAGLSDIRFSTQVAYYAQQMMKAMGGDKMQGQLLDALRARTPEAEEQANEIMEARKDMMMRARDRAEQAFDIFGAGETEQFRDDFATRKALSALDYRDMERMKILIAKIAKRLSVKHSRRRRKKNRGQLDVRRTMRANAGVDGIPFNVVWKQKKRDRPKIIAICDVSGSVAQYVRFLLLLLYSLNDAVPDLHAFAFSHRLGPVDDILKDNDFDPAMKKIMNTYGMGSTSYGQAWSDLKMEHWNLIDRRSTIIVLGDGRSNYGDPRTDLFREATQRAKQTIWLCPEGKSVWGSGDSEMLRYQPYCTQMSHVATLKDLERAVDEILASYA